MRIGSLFSGIGGLDWACEAAFNGETVWQLDQVNAAVRARHWPNALQITADVATVDPCSLPAIDVLCGGFACQDLSDAGKGASKVDLLAGSRTGPTYAGMLRFVEALRPEFVVLENVPALLNHRATLERDLTGYGLTWVVCGAYHVGAPHRRMRVFVLGELGARGAGLVEAPAAAQWSPVESEREWTTITASESKGRRTSLARRDDPDMLSEQVRPWASPRASDSARGSDPKGARQGSPGLVEEVRTWSTPTAGNFNEREDLDQWYARRERIRATGKNGNGMGEPLGVQARWGQDPGTRLSPDWVELLMGYPIGWTRPEGERLTPEWSPRWPRGRYPADWDRSKVWPGYAWEPSRTIPDGPPCPGRPARIRGLGNAVLPQQGAHAITTALRPAQVGLFGAA